MEGHEPGDLGFRFWLRHVRNPTLTWGEISVYAKQRAVLEQVARAKTPALVLEDDPIFETGFASRAEPYFTSLPTNWDFVFFGASCGLPRQGLEGTRRAVVDDRDLRLLHGYCRASHSSNVISPSCASGPGTSVRSPSRTP